MRKLFDVILGYLALVSLMIYVIFAYVAIFRYIYYIAASSFPCWILAFHSSSYRLLRVY